MRQFFLFLKWIPQKALKALLRLHEVIVEAFCDGFGSFVLCSLLLILSSMIIGLLGGVIAANLGWWQFDIAKEVPIQSMLVGVGVALGYIAIVGISALYRVFCEEQAELFRVLKGKQ